MHRSIDAARHVATERTLWHVPELGRDFRLDDGRERVSELHEANLIGSEMRYGKGHLPVIDLDIDHLYWPSSTHGHGHLYLRPAVPVSWPKYERLLRALCDAGVIGWAEYVRAVDRGGSFVRKPGEFKRLPSERMPTARFAATFMRLWWRALWLEVKRERAFRRSSV